MSRFLAIDVGNTQIKVGVFDEDALLFVARLKTDAQRTSHQYAVELSGILSLYKMKSELISNVCISSVVPACAVALSGAINLICNAKVEIISAQTVQAFSVSSAVSEAVGSDMVAAAVAVKSKFALPAVVFCLGTATTMFILDSEGRFCGGAIMAGLGISLEALNKRTAALPFVNITMPKQIIGTNTAECMQSGIVYGAAAMITGMTKMASDEYKQPLNCIITGGYSTVVSPLCEGNVICEEQLILEGLFIIHKQQRNGGL